MSASILDAIGNTPLLEMEGVYVKCEFLNPSGSIKARMAHYMVKRAEEEGLLQPGDTIVEATSGNTGNAFAMVAAAKGYRMLVITPRAFSEERVAISHAFGADVMFVGEYNLSEAVGRAIDMGENPGFWCPRQFENPWNIEENRLWLGQEVVRQLPDDVQIDVVVQGIGTGGTLLGVGQALRAAQESEVELVGVEPAESTTIADGTVGPHGIEGIGDGFVPTLVAENRDQITSLTAVSSEDAIAAMKQLAMKRGMLVGPSSGANWVAAQRLRQEHPESRILTFFCDEGEKYLRDHFG